jgi:bifunctional ADP-heptose synthase (sugar kinase/adenylyltransferase)
MLNATSIERILNRLPSLRIGVVGDLFLDRYLDIDATLTEPSVETGLDAYQVAKVRSFPGAAGTVLNNLVALGVGHVGILSVIGSDGEGFELHRELERRGVNTSYLIEAPERYTPTYTKPLLWSAGQPPKELNRLDIRSRARLPDALQAAIVERLPKLLSDMDALIVLDQVKEPESGVVTTLVRDRLSEMVKAEPDRFILADSRYRIGEFRNVSVKPNRSECSAAVSRRGDLQGDAVALAKKVGGAVFCTCGEEGILLVDCVGGEWKVTRIAGYPVRGPVDPVGAGDSTSAGIACARGAGLSLAEAAAFGNLVASITILQIGTTGTATPNQVHERWREVTGG